MVELKKITMDKINLIIAEIERLIRENIKTDVYKNEQLIAYGKDVDILNKLLSFVKSLLKEPVSEDLNTYINIAYPDQKVILSRGDTCLSCGRVQRDAFKAGANWQKEQDEIEIDKAYKCADEYNTEKVGKTVKKQLIDKILETEYLSDEIKTYWNEISEPDKLFGTSTKINIKNFIEIVTHFIFWYYQRLRKQVEDNLDKSEITLEDIIAFDEGFKLGKQIQKDEMVKNAVDGRVISNQGISFPVSNEISRLGLMESDKVKVIIVKED